MEFVAKTYLEKHNTFKGNIFIVRVESDFATIKTFLNNFKTTYKTKVLLMKPISSGRLECIFQTKLITRSGKQKYYQAVQRPFAEHELKSDYSICTYRLDDFEFRVFNHKLNNVDTNIDVSKLLTKNHYLMNPNFVNDGKWKYEWVIINKTRIDDFFRHKKGSFRINKVFRFGGKYGLLYTSKKKRYIKKRKYVK